MINLNYNTNMRAIVIFTVFNENELEKYAGFYPNIDQLQRQLFTDNGMTALQVLKNSEKSNRG